MQINRRTALSLFAGACAGLSLGPAQARLGIEDDLRVFRDLIRALGGVVVMPPELLAGCEVEFTREFGLEAALDLVALARKRRSFDALIADTNPRVSDQLIWILNFLYSGTVGDKVLYYEWCLGWHALSFATAPGQCGGRFGHWVGPHL